MLSCVDCNLPIPKMLSGLKCLCGHEWDGGKIVKHNKFAKLKAYIRNHQDDSFLCYFLSAFV